MPTVARPLSTAALLLALVVAVPVPSPAQQEPPLPIPPGVDGGCVVPSVPSTCPRDWSQYPQIPPDEAANHLENSARPKYPPIARVAHIEGTVVLQILIDEHGYITDAQALSGSPLLIRSAIDAARQRKYAPFTRDGVPASVTTVVQFDFVSPGGAADLPIYRPFPEIQNLRNVKIALSRSGCYGSCPSYSLEISGDGTVTYDGYMFTCVPDHHSGKISSSDFETLLSAFRTINYFSLLDTYDGPITDVPTFVTSLSVDGASKKIADRYQGPVELHNLEDLIDELAQSKKWVRCDAETVPSLLAEGADLNRTYDGQTVLEGAAAYGDPVAVTDLLRAGANPNVAVKNGVTPVALAAYRGSPEMVSALLNAHANADAKAANGPSVLMFAAASGRPDVVRLILDKKPDVNYRSPDGETALMAGAYSGVPEVVAMLLHAGAKPNFRSKHGMTALLAATQVSEPSSIDYWFGGPYRDDTESDDARDSRENRGEVVRMLVKAGADVNAKNDDGQTALYTLEDDAAEALLKSGIRVDSRDNDGQTALGDSVSHSIVALLIKAGANVNSADNSGTTPLMRAAQYNYVEIMRLLIRAGASLNEQDRNGWTALMHAADRGDPDCVADLLAAHADFRIKNPNGVTALALARMESAHPTAQNPGYPRTIALLEHAGATE